MLRSVGMKTEAAAAEKDKKMTLVSRHPDIVKRATERSHIKLVARNDHTVYQKKVHSRKKRQAFDNENFQRTEMIRMKKVSYLFCRFTTCQPIEVMLCGMLYWEYAHIFADNIKKSDYFIK